LHPHERDAAAAAAALNDLFNKRARNTTKYGSGTGKK
jgi:membrane protein involved in colicin uptake